MWKFNYVQRNILFFLISMRMDYLLARRTDLLQLLSFLQKRILQQLYAWLARRSWVLFAGLNRRSWS